jgi:hypothetical protein
VRACVCRCVTAAAADRCLLLDASFPSRCPCANKEVMCAALIHHGYDTMLIAAGLAVVYVTAPNPQVADSLATALVESRLAACVNILPGVKSVYRWQVSVRGRGWGYSGCVTWCFMPVLCWHTVAKVLSRQRWLLFVTVVQGAHRVQSVLCCVCSTLQTDSRYTWLRPKPCTPSHRARWSATMSCCW